MVAKQSAAATAADVYLTACMSTEESYWCMSSIYKQLITR